MTTQTQKITIDGRELTITMTAQPSPIIDTPDVAWYATEPNGERVDMRIDGRMGLAALRDAPAGTLAADVLRPMAQRVVAAWRRDLDATRERAADRAYLALTDAQRATADAIRSHRDGVTRLLVYLGTPAGGWGETMQAYRDLHDATSSLVEGRIASPIDDADDLVTIGRALGAYDVHPSRLA